MTAPGHIQRFGATAVPWTVSWTGEQSFFVAWCPHARMPAICQQVAPGEGKPRFGAPHSQRQRQAIAEELCDLCGKPLKNRTKVSLSHARSRMNAAGPMDVLQVEPLLHRECAAESMRFCPSLKRDAERGTLMVRQVLRSRVQFAIMAPQFVGYYVPGYEAKEGERIVGAAKVQLIDWKDRGARWLAK